MKMYWTTAVCFITLVFKAKILVAGEKTSIQDELSCRNPKGNIFESVEVTSFTDENRYIRLNISWDKPKANFSNFELMIDTSCSAIYGERNISVNQRYVVEPNMERLKHPADPLLHGCKYDFEFFTEASFGNQTCIISQVAEYKIPECVDDVCHCGIASSPYEYQKIKHVKDHLYKIIFLKTDLNIDLTLEEVFQSALYTNINSNKTMTRIHPQEIKFNNVDNSFILPFNGLHSGETYMVYIYLELDNCEYRFNETLFVPEEFKYPKFYASYFVLVLAICITITLYAFFKTKPQLIEKLRRHFSFLLKGPELPTHTHDFSVNRVTKQVDNSQYTPLEFVLNAYKYDNYEYPKNKIILEDQIGEGAFGHVYKAKVYELDNKPGYTLAAAKKPIENAPPEEIADFLAEIETMKKIAKSGGHKNVIRILACVTIEKPFIMVMELVPCGSLKTYLNVLRKEWEKRRKALHVRHNNNQHFFPDNMIVEHYLIPMSENEEPEKLKYSDLAFDDYTGYSISSGTNSYVTPDTPRSPGSPISNLNIPKTYVKNLRINRTKPCISSNKMVLAGSTPQSPITPDSIPSSGLPSMTETLLTPLESEFDSPLIDLSEGDKLKPVLDSKELHNFASQIANGMAFLEQLQITHRDLAARNILISAEKTLKISDFGMARIGVYVNTSQKREPLRWMAPEAIDHRRCDNKTDVWSFGVVLWEIGSLGAFPYKDLSNDLVIAHIRQGRVLEKPETCTDQVYQLMLKCWHKDPDNRPRFEEIVKQLDITNGKIYVDFSNISSKYVFPPTQE